MLLFHKLKPETFKLISYQLTTLKKIKAKNVKYSVLSFFIQTQKLMTLCLFAVLFNYYRDLKKKLHDVKLKWMSSNI